MVFLVQQGALCDSKFPCNCSDAAQRQRIEDIDKIMESDTEEKACGITDGLLRAVYHSAVLEIEIPILEP